MAAKDGCRATTAFVLVSLFAVLTVSTSAVAEDPSSEHSKETSDSSEKSYPHKSFVKAEYAVGVKSFWLYEPAKPAPKKAPLIVFHHGWMATNPGVYGAWIEHLVKSGNIVVFPRYQVDGSTDVDTFLQNSLASVHDAIDVLETSPKRGLNRIAIGLRSLAIPQVGISASRWQRSPATKVCPSPKWSLLACLERSNSSKPPTSAVCRIGCCW